jgi:hypothetical protein
MSQFLFEAIKMCLIKHNSLSLPAVVVWVEVISLSLSLPAFFRYSFTSFAKFTFRDVLQMNETLILRNLARAGRNFATFNDLFVCFNRRKTIKNEKSSFGKSKDGSLRKQIFGSAARAET